MIHYARHAIRHLLLGSLLLALGHVQVTHAQGTATQALYLSQYGSAIGYGSTAVASCQALPAASNAINPSAALVYSSVTDNGTMCNFTYWNTALSARALGNTAITYNASAVAPLPCPVAGTRKTTNVTLGWGKSPNDDGYAVKNIPDSFYTTPQCFIGMGSQCSGSIKDVTACWQSTVPTAQGLYRSSCDYTVEYTGSSCTPSVTQSAATDSASTPPNCPGSYGTVNGKAVCVISTAPTPAPAPTKSNGTTPDVRAGNPMAGSDGTAPLPSRQPTASGPGGNGGNQSQPTDGTKLVWGNGIPAAAGTTVGNSSSGSGAATVNVDLSQIKTDCDKFPNSIGCSEYGTPESGTLTKRDSGFSAITPVSFASSVACPAPLSFSVGSRTYAVSYQPICDNATTYIRPVVLILGVALAAFVFVGGFRS